MMSILCVLALGLFPAVSAQWTVSSVNLTYVSGTFPDGSSSQSLVGASSWHDTTTSPLVLKFTLVRATATQISTLATPSSSWLKATSRHAPTTLSTAVVISSPTISSDQYVLSYTITLSGAYGAYNLTFDVTQLTDTSNSPGAWGSGATAQTYLPINVGFAPSVSIVNEGSAVTNTWLDPYSVGNVLTITTGSSSIGFSQATGVSAPASPCTTCPTANWTLLTNPVYPLSFTTIAYTSSAVTYNLSAMTPDGPGTGSHVLPITAGLFQRSDSVFNYMATLTVKVGFRPQIMFRDTSNYLGLDTASCVVTPSAISSSDMRYVDTPKAYWFNADLSTIEMRVLPGLTGATGGTLSSGIPVDYMGAVFDYYASGSPASLDAILGVTATSRPGATARSGGIQSSASALPSQSNGLYAAYPIATSGLAPGRYSFVIPAGSIRATDGTYNARTVATLSIGFAPRVQIRTFADGSDVTGTWLDTTSKYASYNISLLPSVGFTLASPTLYTNPTGASVFDSTPSGALNSYSFFSTSSMYGYFTTASASWTLSFAAVPAVQMPNAALPVNISASALLRSDGVYSTFIYTSLKLGFTPSVTFQDVNGSSSSYLPSTTPYSPTYAESTSPTGAVWFSSSLSSVSLNISDYRGSTISQAGTATTSGLFSGISLKFNPATIFGAASITSSVQNSVLYPLTISSLTPGVYPVPIAAGSVCNAAGICNSRGLAFLFIGFDITTKLETLPSIPTGTAVFASTDYADSYVTVPTGTPIDGTSASAKWRLTVGPGVGFSFTTPITASVIDNTQPCQSCSGMAEPSFNYLTSSTATTPCTMTVANDPRTTSSASYGGYGFSVFTTTQGCTAGIKLWGTTTVAGPLGIYIIRIPSGAIPRDDGIYNAVLEYPVVFGAPLDLTVFDSSPTPVGYPVNNLNYWLSPISNYYLKFTVPSSLTGPAITFTSSSPPEWTTTGLFSRQNGLPFSPGSTGVALTSSSPVLPSSTSTLNYQLSFNSSSVGYGQRIHYITAGATPLSITIGSTVYKIYNAASYFTLSVGFLPTLSITNSKGDIYATRTPSGQTDNLFLSPGYTAVADTRNPTLYFTVSLPSGPLSQAAALTYDPTSFVPFGVSASSLTNISLMVGASNSPSTTAFPASGAADYTTSGVFSVRFPISSPTTASLAKTVTAGATTTSIYSIGVNSGMLCILGVCNAAYSNGLIPPYTSAYVSNAGAFTGTVVPPVNLNRLFGWLDGDGAETGTSVPIPTHSSTVYVYFQFAAPFTANKISIGSSSTAISASYDTAVSTGNYYVVKVSGLSSAGQGQYDISISCIPDSGSFGTGIGAPSYCFASQTVRIYYGLDMRAYQFNKGASVLASTEYQKTAPGTLTLSATDVNLGFPGLTFKSASASSFSSIVSSVVDSKGTSVKDTITCYDSAFSPTPCSSATPLGLGFPVTTSSAPYSTATSGAPPGFIGSSSPFTLGSSVYYPVNIGGLADGVYTFTLTGDSTIISDFNSIDPPFNSTFKLIVDRTKPVAVDTISPIAPTSGSFENSVPIPSGMFKDSQSSKLTYTLLSGPTGWVLKDHAGFTGSPAVTSRGAALTTGAFSVAKVDAPLVFRISAKDEAGNSATAALTFTPATPVTFSLTATDARGTSSSPGQALKVKPASDGSLPLQVTALFGAPVGPITAASLLCRSAALNIGGSSSALVGSSTTDCGAVVTVSPGDGVTKSRKFVFTVLIPATSVALISNTNQQFVFGLAGGHHVITAGGVSVESLRVPLQVVVDSVAPTSGWGSTVSNLYSPTMGVYFSQPLTRSMFNDSVTSSASINVLSASPSSQYGLTFSPGVLGVASVSGKVTAMPPSGSLTWAVTVADEAGNTFTDSHSFSLTVYPSLSTGAPVLSMRTTPLTFAKGGSALAIGSSTSISNLPSSGVPETLVTRTGTYSGAQILVTLSSPDAGVTDPACTYTRVTSPAPRENHDCEYVKSTATMSGQTEIYFDPDSGLIEMLYSHPTGSRLTSADISSFLSGLTYYNTRNIVSSGARTVTVYILADYKANIIASATRSITVTTTSSTPVIATTPVAPTLAFSSSSSNFIYSGASAFTITDSDDSSLSSATIQIASCDTARDSLSIASATPMSVASGVITYASAFSAVKYDFKSGNSLPDYSVYGTWIPASCSFIIKPATGSSAPIAAYITALKSVVYVNLDTSNPTNWAVATSVTKSFSLTVTDAASAGRSTTPSTSSALVSTLTITKADQAAVISKRAAFGAGGFLSNSDSLAKTYYDYDSTGVIPVKKFYVDRTASSATLKLNLGVSTTKGVFAGGAITDSDTALITDSSISPRVTCSGCSSAVTSNFNSATGLLTISIASPALTTTSPVDFTFSWDTVGAVNAVSTIFKVDFLTPGCVLQGGKVTNAVPTADLANTLPANDLCVFAPTTVSTSDTTSSVISLGDFTGANATLNNAAAALASLGVSTAQQITALAAQRSAARGFSSVVIPPGSLVGAGSAAITTSVPGTSTRVLLNSLQGASALDLTLGLVLGPAGQYFSAPVRVCIFVGDTVDGFYRALYTASQISPTDPSKGYGPLTLLSNQEFNPATGQVCGDATHFSFFGPGLVALPPTLYVPKSTGIGGACPNACSGQGTCRKEGKCQCFPGFMGYDCSARSCPTGPSWGQSSGSGSGYFGNDVTLPNYPSSRVDAECSGRGLCDRTKSTCACFPGFEGPACQRIACPNKCGGHGKCRFLSELSSASGYSSWEARRVQKCVCDGGYTGADCSQRLCPFGDDPETICADTARQVQRVSLYFGSASSPSLPTSASIVDLTSSAQLALRFKAIDGAVYTTTAIGSTSTPLWGSNAADAAAASALMSSALTSLPSGVVTGVSISGDATTSSARRTFDVTFTGPTNTGNEALMSCATNSDGYTLGCQTAGCRPFFRQPRLLNTDPSPVGASSYISVAAAAILLQPSALTGGNSAESASVNGFWGVETTLTVSKSSSGGGYTYSFGTTKVYGTAGGESVPESPLPPLALRSTLAGPYGLLVKVGSDSELGQVFTGPVTQVTIVYKWSLPTCTVTQVSSAAADLEKAECANRGVCDRSAGKCKCFEGYSGSSCNAQVMYV